MNQNGFREDELVTRRLNGQTRVFPVVGGRLRLAHEENDSLSLETEMVSWDGQYAVFRCKARTKKGDFAGAGHMLRHSVNVEDGQGWPEDREDGELWGLALEDAVWDLYQLEY